MGLDAVGGGAVAGGFTFCFFDALSNLLRGRPLFERYHVR